MYNALSTVAPVEEKQQLQRLSDQILARMNENQRLLFQAPPPLEGSTRARLETYIQDDYGRQWRLQQLIRGEHVSEDVVQGFVRKHGLPSAQSLWRLGYRTLCGAAHAPNPADRAIMWAHAREMKRQSEELARQERPSRQRGPAGSRPGRRRWGAAPRAPDPPPRNAPGAGAVRRPPECSPPRRPPSPECITLSAAGSPPRGRASAEPHRPGGSPARPPAVHPPPPSEPAPLRRGSGSASLFSSQSSLRDFLEHGFEASRSPSGHSG